MFEQSELITEIETTLRCRPMNPVLAVRFLHRLVDLGREMSFRTLGSVAQVSAERLAEFESGHTYLSQPELLRTVIAIRDVLRSQNQIRRKEIRRQARIQAWAARPQGRIPRRVPVTDRIAAVPELP